MPTRSWRGCKEWADMGLPMSTTNDEACKLYDALLSQSIEMQDDASVGGIGESSKKLLEADPSFIMGQALVYGSATAGGLTLPREGEDEEDVKFRKGINTFFEQASRKSAELTWREKTHVEAIRLWTEGKVWEATLKWEEIIVEFPNDLLAVKHLHNNYFWLGEARQLRDSMARVIPFWKPHMQHYGYLCGMYAFGLEESAEYEKAEKMARKALELQPRDGWANHALGHVFEMQGRFEEGKQHMASNADDWSKSYIASHTFWHWALYHIETGDYEAALDVYDSELLPRSRQGANLLGVTDAASLLYRFKFEGVDVGDRWDEVFAQADRFLSRQCLPFLDILVYSSCVGSKQTDRAKETLESMKEFASGAGDFQLVAKEIGVPLCEAINAYEDGRYGDTVDLMLPRKHKLNLLSGSHAQRSIFDLFLIDAAIKSPTNKHQLLARQLLQQNLISKGNSPLSERWMKRIVLTFDD